MVEPFQIALAMAALSPLFLGIDFGTSGARAIAIDGQGAIAARARYDFPESVVGGLAAVWVGALWDVIGQIPAEVRRQIEAIAINGTSATVLLCDGAGNPVTEPLLYSDSRGVSVLERVKAIAPANHTVISATSSLAKLLWWQEAGINGEYFLHQADWLAFLLHGQLGITDYHNALKLGFDVETLQYPDWLQPVVRHLKLPQVFTPGEAIAPVTEAIASRLGLSPNCRVCAGTTDSIAAFLASGAQLPGEAVTSLGSTLVLKLLSTCRVDDSRYGIYSHRLGDRWLVGGASNTGGAVLKQFFTAEELAELSQKINPLESSGLDYYPLLRPGERFPINDPDLPPRLSPRPDRPSHFLHGLLEGIAKIEVRGYQLLQTLGATPLQTVYTAGGGAQNEVWTRMRSQLLKVPVVRSPQSEAAYGTAILARDGLASS